MAFVVFVYVRESKLMNQIISSVSDLMFSHLSTCILSNSEKGKHLAAYLPTSSVAVVLTSRLSLISYTGEEVSFKKCSLTMS